jgi:hypothetical protein
MLGLKNDYAIVCMDHGVKESTFTELAETFQELKTFLYLMTPSSLLTSHQLGLHMSVSI